MNRLLLALGTLALGAAGAQAQSLSDYVDETRGDTLVIKNYADMEFVPGSLVDAIELDTDAPPGRVYMLKAGANGDLTTSHSLYPSDRQVTLPDRPIVIVGEYCGQMVQGEDPTCRPPLISGFLDEGGAAVNSNVINTQNDLTYKNLAISPSAPDGSEGWTFTEVTGEDVTVRLENVLGEHSNWTLIQSNTGVGTSLYISDSYFLNATGVATRRNGGVYDSENQPLDTLWVENTTHLQNAGMQYKFRNHPANKVVVNHNTFANAAGHVLLSFGYETNMTVTNNLFVNSNYQPYFPGLDGNETDQDNLPHGIINLNHLPDGFDVADADRKVLVDLNGAYWDSRLVGIADQLNSDGVSGSVCASSGCESSGTWVTQAMTANSRTEQIFDDASRYPLITEGTWYMDGAPNFEDLPDMIDELVEWGYDSVSDGNTTLLANCLLYTSPSPRDS